MGAGPNQDLEDSEGCRTAFKLLVGGMIFLSILSFLPWKLHIPVTASFTVLALTLVFAANTIASIIYEHNLERRFLATSLIQIIAVFLLSVGAIDPKLRLSFIASALGLVILTQLGAYAVQLYRERTISRLYKGEFKQGLYVYPYKELVDQSQSIEKSIEKRSLAYYGLLVGMFCGFIVALILGEKNRPAAMMAVHGGIFGMIFILLYEIIRNAAHMAIPTYGAKIDSREEKTLDLAVIISDIRKTFLWSALYAIVVFCVLVLLELHLFHLKLPLLFLLLGILFLILFSMQVPYIIGQSRARSYMLTDYHGIKREEMREKLQKYAPIFPVIQSLSAITASGTAGGIIFILLVKALEEIVGAKK